MASLSKPIHISFQKLRISSLYSLPRSVSTKTNHGLLQSRVFDVKCSTLAFSPFLEKGKHLITLQAAHSRSDKSSKNFSERFPAFVTAFFYLMWYFVHVIFYAIKNKVDKYYLPHPFLVFVAHLLVGMGYCLLAWALGVRESHVLSVIFDLVIDYIPWGQLKVLIISFVRLIFRKR